MRKLQKGFTLIELMIVVAMIGLLASVGYASFNRYIYETKVKEKEANTQRIIDAFDQVARFGSSAKMIGDGFKAGGGAFNNSRFVTSGGWTPTWTSCINSGGKCTATANWDRPLWRELKFELMRPARTSYLAYRWENAWYNYLLLYTMSDLDGDCPPNTWSGCAEYKYHQVIHYKKLNRTIRRVRYFSRD